MIRKLVSLVVFLLVVNAGVRGGLAFFHDQQFKDAVRDVALFGAGKPDDILKARVMDLAGENQIPLDPDFITIERSTVVGTNDHVKITFSYAEMIPIVPGFPRRFQFDYSTP